MKQETFANRATPLVYNDKIMRIPICPVCEQAVTVPSMHEVFVTRAHSAGLKYPQAGYPHTPENIVLVHEGKCHRLAQSNTDSKIRCALQILQYHTQEEVEEFFNALPTVAMIEGRALLFAAVRRKELGNEQKND